MSDKAEDYVQGEAISADDHTGESCEPGDAIHDDENELEQQDWSALTVAALKAELAGRGLQTSGRKADLVARLEASITVSDSNLPENLTKENENSHLVIPSEEPHKEPEEGGDEIPEGDEFVEWNEDADHDGVIDEAKCNEYADGTDESALKLAEVVDELRPEADEQKASNEKSEFHVEEGDVKQEGGELSVDVHREKDLFYLTWQSKKITVPMKGEITKDLQVFDKLLTVIIYPVTLPDIYCDDFKKYMDQVTGVEVELEDMQTGKPPKGFLKLKFKTAEDAQQALEGLKTFREGITVKNFSKDDNESHIMNQLRKDECDRKGPIIYRLVYVGNLPADATEATLREHFPEALQVIIPHNEETMERLGYAYLEFADEKIAQEMSDKYKDAEINGAKLYVIQAIPEKKEKYGLLRDSLRLYWSEQVCRLRKILDKPRSRSQWEMKDAEQKLSVLKRRLEKDDRRREALHLPCPSYSTDEDKDGDRDRKESGHNGERAEVSKEKKSPSKKVSRSKSRDRRPSHHEHRRRSPRRSPPPPPPRREYRPPRVPVRRDNTADKLVNQLQGLLSTLAHKLPVVEPPRPLMGDLQFGPLNDLIDQQRRLGTSSFSSAGFRGSSYGGQSYSSIDGPGSSRFTAGKRYNDDDYGGDRKRRMTNYDNSGSGSSRFASGGNSRGGGGGQFYGSSRRDSSGPGGRQFSGGRPRWS